jgi:hypothetical protein
MKVFIWRIRYTLLMNKLTDIGYRSAWRYSDNAIWERMNDTTLCPYCAVEHDIQDWGD